MDKAEIIRSIGKLEGDLSQAEATQREAERKLQGTKGNRTAGAAVLLIGILGILFLSGIWYLWAFLIIIGGLTLFTAISKQNTAQGELTWAEQTITTARSKLAELRAQLSVL